MLEVDIGDNPLALVENLSIKKAFKDLLNDVDNNKLLSQSPLFKTSLLDLDKILTSQKKIQRKIVFDENEKNIRVQEFQNGKFDLRNLKVESQQMMAGQQQQMMMINQSQHMMMISQQQQMNQLFNTIQDINIGQPTSYVLGKKSMQNRKLKMKKYVDNHFDRKSQNALNYKQYLIGDLIK